LLVPLYVYCTKIFSRSHSAKAYRVPESPGTVNWRTPVISINLFSRKSSSPDFSTCSTTGMSRSHCSCLLRPLSRKTINPGWTGASRSSMKSRAFVVTTAKSYRAHTARQHDPLDPQDQRAVQIANTHRGQLTVARVLAKRFHPAGDGSCALPASKPQPLSWSSRPLAEAREEPSISQVAGAERMEVLRDFLFRNSLPKECRDMLKGYASTTKDRFSP